MVFVLEERAKIEADRRIDPANRLNTNHRLETSDDATESQGEKFFRSLNKIMENYMAYSQFYAWGKLTGVL